MREVAAFAMEDEFEEEEGEVPDLLSGVQDRLRERSRGRFYRDRFSKNARRGPPFVLLVGLVMLVTLAVAWVALRSMVIVAGSQSEAPSAPAHPEPSEGRREGGEGAPSSGDRGASEGASPRGGEGGAPKGDERRPRVSSLGEEVRLASRGEKMPTDLCDILAIAPEGAAER